MKTEDKSGDKGLDLFQINFPAPTPAGGGQTRRLKTLVRNAGVDRGSVEIDVSESGSQSQDDDNGISKRIKKFYMMRLYLKS